MSLARILRKIFRNLIRPFAHGKLILQLAGKEISRAMFYLKVGRSNRPPATFK